MLNAQLQTQILGGVGGGSNWQGRDPMDYQPQKTLKALMKCSAMTMLSVCVCVCVEGGNLYSTWDEHKEWELEFGMYRSAMYCHIIYEFTYLCLDHLRGHQQQPRMHGNHP